MAAVDITAVAQAAVRCPRDGSEAVVTEGKGRGRFKIDVCPQCGGAWFDRGEIAKAAKDREVERLIVAYAAGRSELSCPRCAERMARRPVGEVTVDVCLHCEGVWMDAGELEAAARTLAGEFSSVDIGPQPWGITRGAVVSGRFWGASRSLRVILQPPMKREYPRDKL